MQPGRCFRYDPSEPGFRRWSIPRVVFDPTHIDDGACVEGHLDAEPMYGVLLSIHRKQVTGRLTIADSVGPNHMYFMQGRPVGVLLSDFIHPLGQLLLELGRINGATFVRAQRLIAEGNRLAGQVFKELGVLDDQALRDVLSVQARKKAEHLCRLGSRSFSFCSGLTYLVGFTSTPLDMWVVVYLAVRAQFGSEARITWIDGLRDHQVRIVNAPGAETGLPTALESFGFGAAEERFLQRIVGGWEKVGELCDTGTLPSDEAAVLLRYLEVIGRLERRRAPTPVAVAPPAAPASARPARVDRADTSDDVFSSAEPNRSPRPVARAPVPEPDVFAGPDEATGPQPHAPRDARAPSAAARAGAAGTTPGRPAVARTVPDRPSLGGTAPDEPLIARTQPERPAVPRSPVDRPAERPAASRPAPAPVPSRPSPPVSEPRRIRSVPVPEPAQAAPPPPTLQHEAEELAPVVKPKKKVRRTEPLPSEGSGVRVSETRKEKTNVGPMPSIVIEDD